MHEPNDKVSITIRQAQESDLQACRLIEDDAGEIFAAIGMTEIDDDPPRGLDDLRAAQRRGDVWIACDRNDVPVAFALTATVDGNLHLDEMGVLRSWQRQGIGRRLIDHLIATATARGLPAITLTTFRAVPWNAPYYEHLGFTAIAETVYGPEMAALVAEEERHGLDRQTRVVMRRSL